MGILQRHWLVDEEGIVCAIASGQTWCWCKYYGAPVRQMVRRVLVSWMFVGRLGEANLLNNLGETRASRRRWP